MLTVRQGLGDPAPSHPCEGDVMPFLQMRKLRPRAEVMCARPSQDVLTWRQGGPGPSMAESAASLEDLLPLLPQDSAEWQRPRSEGAAGSAAGSGWRSFKASPSFLAELPRLTASLVQRKADSYLGLSPAN